MTIYTLEITNEIVAVAHGYQNLPLSTSGITETINIKNSIFIIKYIGKKQNHKRIETNNTGLAQNNIESKRDSITPLDFFISFRTGLGKLS